MTSVTNPPVLAAPAPPPPPPSPSPFSPFRLLRRSSVRIAIIGSLLANVLLLLLGGDHLPFSASPLARATTPESVFNADAMFVEVFALMGLVYFLTRRRKVPDMADRAPEPRIARLETLVVLAYGGAALLGGWFVGHAFGWHAFSFHVEGSVIGTDRPVLPTEVLCWSIYNLLVYAVLPFIVFRTRYSVDQLSLRSSDWRADLRLILVVLALESTVQLLFNPSILSLDVRQILIGVPLTFGVFFAGTVMPTMVFIYCILTPRYLKLSRSVPATVILGGLTYALLHVFDGWTNFATPTDSLLSVLYLLLFYTGPGMFKTFITLRTANAWVHVWAYHAIAPHTLLDTPMMVKVFGIHG